VAINDFIEQAAVELSPKLNAKMLEKFSSRIEWSGC